MTILCDKGKSADLIGYHHFTQLSSELRENQISAPESWSDEGEETAA
jgi:hypothetical protein